MTTPRSPWRELPWRAGMALYGLFTGAWLLRGLASGAGAGYPVEEIVQDYVFSALLLIPAVLLLRNAEHRWAYRWLGLGLTGVAGAYNLQARVADRRFEVWGASLLHGVGTAACVAGLLLLAAGPPDRRTRWLVAVPACLAGVIGGGLSGYAPSIGFLASCCLLTPLLALVPVATPDGDQRATGRLVRSVSVALAGVSVLVVGTAWVTQRLQTPGLLGDVTGVSVSGPEIWHYPAGLGGLGGQVAAFWVCRFLVVVAFAALAAGLLRERPADVDHLMSRAVVYSLLTAAVGAVYVLGAVRIDAVFGLDSDWLAPPQVAAAGLAALAFVPVRAALERFVDRVIYGRRLSSREVLAQVGALARAGSGGTEALRSLAGLTARTLGVDEAAVHLGRAEDQELTVRWPDPDRELAAELRIPVSFQGVAVGALAIPATNRSLPRHRRALLPDLGRGAAVVMRNAAQSLDLRRRLDDASARSTEIRASRWRIVTAQDSERRDLERDLHDSAQPALTSVRLALGLVNHLAGADKNGAYGLALVRLRNQILLASTSLRRALRGIDPPALTASGIVAALRETAESLDIEVDFDIDPGIEGTRFDRPVEAAVYYCCGEALHNATKHSPDAAVRVALAMEDNGSTLRFTVADDGPGFDSDSVAGGSGLQNMSDRLAAVDGHLVIDSRPGAGTRVLGTVPVGPQVQLTLRSRPSQ